MKRNRKNIEDVLKRHLPWPTPEETESKCDRILQNLRSGHVVAKETELLDSLSDLRAPWRIALIPAAAAIILAVVIGLLWRQDALAVGETVDGALYRVVNGKTLALKSGAKIGIGDTVRTDRKAGGLIQLTDGSSVEVRSESELSFEGTKPDVQISVNRGSVIVDSSLSDSGISSVVQTKDIRVPVAGTVFVNAEPIGSRVLLIRGEARVQQGTSKRTLRPGEQMTTNPNMEVQSISREIAWSRQALTHMALLQESTSPKPVDAREAFEVVAIRMRPTGGAGGLRGVTSRENDGHGEPCAREKVEIDPSRYSSTGVTLYTLVTVAYGLGTWGLPDDVGVGDFSGGVFTCRIALSSNLLSGGPEWIKSARFDIETVIPKGQPVFTTLVNNKGTVIRSMTPRLQGMLRTLLEDRFKLKLRRETREMPVYLLTVGRGGFKLPQWKEGDWIGISSSAGHIYDGRNNGPETTPQYEGLIVGELQGGRMPMPALAERLARVTNRPVIDRTGIQGYFNYGIFFAPVDPLPNDTRPRLNSPSLFKALEEEAGLQLESARAPMEVFVIESVEKPSEN
jgi:uncharacterized protein (TIGR03435 family)